MTRSTHSRPKASTNPGPKRRSRAAPAAGQPAQTTGQPPSKDLAQHPSKLALAWAHSARFFTTAAQLHQLPVHELPEIAFVGRSNAGKSTAINTLAQQRQLAFASKTPGRTQHINLFHLGAKAAPDQIWADLPGYGYAAVERTAKLRWQEVMADYLAWRRNLRAVVQMVDSRHGFTDLDTQLLGFVAPRVRTGEVKLLVLLTKADKLSRREAQLAMTAAQEVLLKDMWRTRREEGFADLVGLAWTLQQHPAQQRPPLLVCGPQDVRWQRGEPVEIEFWHGQTQGVADLLQEMIDEADRDGDGEISEDEFLRIMKKTSLY